ncbi:hypothetical protein ABS768_17675, partial [Flavobacterium sp. ST-75]
EYGNGIIYAQTFVEAPSDRQAVLHFGAGGPLKIFLNDVEIYSNEKIKSTDLNAYQLKFNLKKGMNRLVIKSSLKGKSDYFFAALKDISSKSFTDLVYYDTYKDYQKSALADINPEEVAPDFEVFLQEKVKSQPDNPLFALLLFDAYSYNQKNEKAYEAIEKLVKKYPGSSLINHKLVTYYNNTENYEK